MLKMGKKAQNIWKLGKNVQNLKIFWKRDGYRMQYTARKGPDDCNLSQFIVIEKSIICRNYENVWHTYRRGYNKKWQSLSTLTRRH